MQGLDRIAVNLPPQSLLMIVLYNPVSSASRKPVLPLAVLALAARMSWRVVIVDGNIERHPVGRIASLVAGHGDGPVILGVTVMPGPQLQDALRVCRELRAREVPLTIVWGGYFPTQHWSCCVSDVCVDYVIRGHGDEAFPQLVEHLLQGKGDLSAIEGLAWRDENGGALNPGVAKARDAGETAVWPFELVDVAKYIRPTFLGSRTLGYHSSFGCPFVCNFCAVVNMDQGRWLAQPAAYVAQVAELYVRDFGVNAIEFYDNNFFVSEERVEEVSKRIQGLDIGWWGEARVDRLLRYSDSTWQGMRDSGLKMVFMGAESGNAETLKRMDKGGTLRPEMTLELVESLDAIAPGQFKMVLKDAVATGLARVATAYRIVQRRFFVEEVARLAALNNEPAPTGPEDPRFAEFLIGVEQPGPATGPYQLARDPTTGRTVWRSGVDILMMQNPRSFKRAIETESWNLAGIKLVVLQDPSARRTALGREEIDFVLDRDAEATLQSFSGLAKLFRPMSYGYRNLGPWYVVWNHDHPALGDVRVRRALTMLFDRERITEVLAPGAKRARSWFRDDSGRVPAGFQPLEHDIDAARARVAHEFGREQQQHRPHPLAPGREHVLAEDPHQRAHGFELIAQGAFHEAKRVLEALEDIAEGGRRRGGLRHPRDPSRGARTCQRPKPRKLY